MVNKKKIYSSVLLLLVEIIIFILSSQNSTKSSNLSQGILSKVANIIDNITKKDIHWNIELLENIFRTFAHGFIFFVLGFAILNFIYSYEFRLPVFYALVLLVVSALFDEFHQYFVPGRTFQFQDIVVNILGGSLAILIGFKCKKEIGDNNG